MQTEINENTVKVLNAVIVTLQSLQEAQKHLIEQSRTSASTPESNWKPSDPVLTPDAREMFEQLGEALMEGKGYSAAEIAHLYARLFEYLYGMSYKTWREAMETMEIIETKEKFDDVMGTSAL